MTYRLMSGTALALTIAGGPLLAQELELLLDQTPNTQAAFEALTTAYTAKNPDVTFDIEIRPGGSEGDNVIKSRLATGEMPDLFVYNSGSLLQALRPDRTLAPINDIENLALLNEAYRSTVSGADGDVYGVPFEAAMGGGIFYHIPTYEKLGLEVPKTWDDFMANNAVIAEQTEAAPIAQTYREPWTSQVLVLGDFYNVLQSNPEFPESFTANEAKFATTSAAQKGFQRLQSAYEAGYFNEDFGAASYNDGLQMVATGEAVHYPMLTFAIGAIEQNFPEQLQDVGFFAQPGDSAEQNGLTIWMPSSIYIPRSTENLETAKDFVNFMASPEACDILIEAIGATGPYLIEGCDMPADIPPSVAGMMPYFEMENGTAPALEFLSPVKGPALEQLTVEVGSGIRDAQSAAELYDQDVAKQARQLGLDNW